MAKNEVIISPMTETYWTEAETLFKAVGSLAGALKLKKNLEDPSNAWKVQHVFEEYYKSDMRFLTDVINFRYDICKGKIERLNLACKYVGLSGIKNPEKLIDLLLYNKRLAFYRKEMKRHLKLNEVVTLQEIEKDFRDKNEPAK